MTKKEVTMNDIEQLDEILTNFERTATEAILDEENTDIQTIKILIRNRNQAKQKLLAMFNEARIKEVKPFVLNMDSILAGEPKDALYYVNDMAVTRLAQLKAKGE